MYKTYWIVAKTRNVKSKLVKLDANNNGPVLQGRKIRVLKNDGTLEERCLKLDDLQLKVNVSKGQVVEKDVTCDSVFMLEHIRDIGQSIRDAYSFLDRSEPVTLFMDDAGGPGKTEVKERYEKI